MDIFNYLKENFKVYTVEECKQLEKDKGAYGVIYITQCKVNSKLYIGKKKIDMKNFKTYLGSGVALTRAVDKYGRDNFERIILEVAYSKEELDNFEIKYIELFDASEEDSFYNIALGGDGGVCLKGEDNPSYGKHLSEETKKKISEANKGVNSPNYGKHLSEETKKKIGEARKGKYAGVNHPNYGKHHSEEAKKKIGEVHRGKEISEETKKKMSEARKGKKHPLYGKHLSEEAKKKLSEAKKGKKHSEETKKKLSEVKRGKNNPTAKLVVAIFPDGRIIKDVCMKELAKELKTTEDTIRSRLNSHEPYKPRNKHLKHLEGIIIMYQKDYLDMINSNTNINDDKAS